LHDHVLLLPFCSLGLSMILLCVSVFLNDEREI
jgi:hypothetical protein